MSKALIPLLLAGVLLVGSFFSCKYNPASHGCDTCNKPCDTCNLNQDSLQRIKDSLAHAFTWTEYIGKIPNETNLTGVWVFGPNDIIIVANSLWHFDGTNFTVVPAFNSQTGRPINGALSGFSIFALSKTDYWLTDGIAFHTTDGKYFDDLRPPINITACWGTKSDDMFFVGTSGNIFHYDGKNFTKMTSNTTKDLRSVWGTSSSDVWAAGYNESTGESVLVYYNGSNWQEINLTLSPLNIYLGSTGHSLDYVWAVDSAGYKVVIPSGSLIWRQTNNGLWRSDSLLLPNHAPGGGFIALSGTQGNSANDFMTVGGWGWVGHWNGKTWKKYEELFDYGNPGYGPAGFSYRGNVACIVGVKGGQGWIALGSRK